MQRELPLILTSLLFGLSVVDAASTGCSADSSSVETEAPCAVSFNCSGTTSCSAMTTTCSSQTASTATSTTCATSSTSATSTVVPTSSTTT